MKRRNFAKFLGVTSAVGFLAGKADAVNLKRPNIIFILVDDMGWSDIGCYGGEIETPNLDFLADNGIRFTQMHNTAKCFPSRACLLTGVYAQQCNMSKKFEGIHNAITIGDLTRSVGYRTLASGKHHSQESLYEKGFDHYWGLRDGCCNFFNPGERRPGEPEPAQKKPQQRVFVFDEEVHQPYTPPEKDFYTTDYFTKWAINWLDQYKREEKPYLLYLAYTAPHDPIQAWPEDIAKYKETYTAGFAAIRKARHEKQKKMGLVDASMPLSKEWSQAWDHLSEADQAHEAHAMAVYAAMIDRVDQNIGKVLNKIKELGEEDNTLIMFASDNGCSPARINKGKGEVGAMDRYYSVGQDWANVSNTPFRRFKSDSFEGGICTPFIAYWPAMIKNKGTFNRQSTHFVDVMSTIQEITGAAYPKTFRNENIAPMQGESLVPAFRGKLMPQRKNPIYWQWHDGSALVSGNWKIVRGKKGKGKGKKKTVDPATGSWELYDLKTDKTETTNLADTYPEKVEELGKKWDALHQGFTS